MTDPAPWQLAATELQRRYRARSLTPLAVAEACLSRLDAVNPGLNAVIARRDAAFLDDARSATARFAAGQPLSMLDGIPLTVKDNLPTRDLPTCWGLPALRDQRPPHDEAAVARARAGGALLLGKTNVPEFTLEGYTANSVHGITRNPWDLRLTPGGSSGGAVAALAAGIAPLALGTDGGGSIRRPASHAGVVGFKPSAGVIARDHGLPPLMFDFEVVGTMARTVADARLLFDAVRDVPGVAADVRPARILLVERLGDAPVDPQVLESTRGAARALAALGHRVETGPLPIALDFMETEWPLVAPIGLAALMREHPAWFEGASEKWARMATEGAGLSAPRVAQLHERTRALRDACAAMFERLDAILMPSAAALPWAADQPFAASIAGETVGPRGHAIYTGWVNAAGLPAIGLPGAPSQEGLPIGFQLIAAHGRDDFLFALAAQYESAHPFAGRWPHPA